MKSGAIILAAGKGTRMKSDLPKVLHKAAGKPMIRHILDRVREAELDEVCIVVGHGGAEVRAALGEDYLYAVQEPQLGTGHCVMQAMPAVSADVEGVLVVCGDTPLLRTETFVALKKKFEASKAACVVLTAIPADPTGYGRILRDAEGSVCGIVEQKDATEEQKAIREVNTGTYFFDLAKLRVALDNITNDNAQGEYYLTDTLAWLKNQGEKVEGVICPDEHETLGVNDRVQLAEATKTLYARKAEELMRAGVTLIDPAAVYIEQDVEVGADTVIYPNCHLRGKTVIGKGCVIDADCQLTDSIVGDGSTLIKTIMVEAEVGKNCTLGPFAYLRPGTKAEDKVKLGHFVEVKKSYVKSGAKVPHLTYIVDAEIGHDVNIGCGTITCNYDGVNKFKTVVADGAFVGSNTNLVAPVNIGEGAYIAAGSTIIEDVPADALAIARGRQAVIDGWAAENSPQAKKKAGK